MLYLAFKTIIKCLFAIALCFVLLPAQAQINHESEGNHKQLRKKFLKQANYVDTQFSDSHLNMSSYNFKKGESGRSAETKNKKRVQTKRDTNKRKGFLFWKRESQKNRKKDS